MHILLITDKSLPSRGGSQAVFHQVYRRFPPGTVTMLTRAYREAASFDCTTDYGIRRVPYLDVPKLRMPLLWSTLAVAASRVRYQCGADQIHCGQSIETGFIGWWCKRRYGIPYVVHTFGEEIRIYGRGRLTRRVLSRLLKNADAVTTISRYSHGQLLDLGLDPRRIHLIGMGVDLKAATNEEGAALRRRYGLEGRQVLLTVGRLAPRKGHDRVLRALPHVAARVPSVAYLVVGDGPERARLERLTQALGIGDRVIFAGLLPEREKAACYRASDLFVMPNRQLANGDVEGFGLVFLEANASGLAVIGGRSGGTEDAVVHGETGWLIDPDDEDLLSGYIIELLRDPRLARRFGEAGRQRVLSDFAWERSAADVERIALRLSSQYRRRQSPGMA
jgi:phosphatidylinositol alpha-1,6-mannosyltransferase